DPGLGGRFLRNEVEQNGGDLQYMGVDAFHAGISCSKWLFVAAFGRNAAEYTRRRVVFGPIRPKTGAMRRPPKVCQNVKARCVAGSGLSGVVLAKARTHYPREQFCEDALSGTPIRSYR